MDKNVSRDNEKILEFSYARIGEQQGEGKKRDAPGLNVVEYSCDTKAATKQSKGDLTRRDGPFVFQILSVVFFAHEYLLPMDAPQHDMIDILRAPLPCLSTHRYHRSAFT